MISTNIILFSEKPLESNIQVYSYEVSKECSYYDIGDIILETRPFHKNVIIFQYGLLILSSKSLKFPRKHQKDIITEKIITLSLNVPEDLEKLQYLLGEAIASFLRIQDNDKWRANRGKGLVYYAQKLLGSQEFQPLSVWEGFKYTPIVFKDGRAGIIIDPRFKIYHRKNLRDLSPKERKLLVNQTVIVTCPNDYCTLKKDQF